MGLEGGEGDSSLDDVLDGMSGDSDPFRLLRCLGTLLAHGIPLDDPVLGRVAECLGAAEDNVRAVAQVVTRMMEPEGGVRIRLCKSVSCTGNGADGLEKAMEGLIQDSGSTVKTEVVYCLDQCERGPSFEMGDLVYTGRLEEVHRDERPWRSES